MKKWLAFAVLLLAATSARAQFPNTYTATPTVTYDPLHGTVDPARGITPGMITVTVAFHGSTTGSVMNQSGIQHKPRPFVIVKNASQGYLGPGFLPNTDMGGWSHQFTFDLQASGCDFQVLESGGCEVDNEPQIYCPIHNYFNIPWKKVQLEAAITKSYVKWNTKGINRDGIAFYDAAPWCNPISSPPDFPGPDTVYWGVDPLDGSDDIWTETICWRVIDWGSNGNFEPWICNNSPRQGYYTYIQEQADPNLAPGVCTCHDAGAFPKWPGT